MKKKAIKVTNKKRVVKEPIKIDFAGIESKWQKEWEKKKIFEVKENPKKKKYYVLDMFPYPSGTGLHMGHAFVFSLGDVYARFKRLQGYNVLYPIGYDSLGLPAENAAIKAGTHPKEYTEKSISNFMKQQKAMGWSYDWKRLVKTSDTSYYKWDQWIFLKMLEKGLAYRKKSAVNFCVKCNTVLANEQVINGKCWRHEDTSVEIKHLEQWFLRITNYAEELLDYLEKLDWPENAKKLQKNWIGKSYGTEIDFEINGKKWPIFTTRPDTIYGVTFMVVSAQHSRLMELVTSSEKTKVDKFLKKLNSVSEKQLENMEKEGVFTGSYAINPLTKEKVPIYAGNFVVADYGSGMVMAVPAHDKRDFEFAKKYSLPIKVVIQPKEFELESNKIAEAYTGDGWLINSKEFNNLDKKDAILKITEELEKKKLGRKKVQYKLRDWLISRQRYWGTPIPIVYCDKCGIVPINEKDLPVKLPEKVVFGKGNPLETNKQFVEVKCPKCKSKARREIDTMDTFVNSSWYYLRYTDSKNKNKIFDVKKANYWAPIDQYIGGPEHITMHLIYIRFYTKFLRDIGLLEFDEPALKYFTQGIVKGSDGEKMSKSRGNVVEPLDTIKKYGADTLRLALLSTSSPDKDVSWDEKVVLGSHKFLNKVYEYGSKNKFSNKIKNDAKIESKINKTIKNVTDDIQNFRHNLAIIKLRQFFDYIYEKEVNREVFEKFLLMIQVYCPYITEELWHKIGNKSFIGLEKWPIFDEKKINDALEREEEQIDKIVFDINNILKILETKGEKNKKKVIVFAIPNEVSLYKGELEQIRKRVGMNVEIKDIKESKSLDKKVSAKPGKPGIYIE